LADGLWYESKSPSGRQFIRVRLDPARSEPLFDHERLADLLTEELGAAVRADSLPISQVYMAGADTLAFAVRGKRFVWPLADQMLRQPDSEVNDRPRGERRSPDGRWTAVARDYNLYLRDNETGEETALSDDGEKGYEYA
jgi:dipeptidyl-peptidase-4